MYPSIIVSVIPQRNARSALLTPGVGGSAWTAIVSFSLCSGFSSDIVRFAVLAAEQEKLGMEVVFDA